VDEKRFTNVMVVGGGLISAKIGDLAIRRGVTKVWHIMLISQAYDASTEI
jgi:hypothetical protein